jgi:hypothetical protein
MFLTFDKPDPPRTEGTSHCTRRPQPSDSERPGLELAPPGEDRSDKEKDEATLIFRYL